MLSVFNPPSCNLKARIGNVEYALPFHPKAAHCGLQIEDWNKEIVGLVQYEKHTGTPDLLRTLWFLGIDGRTYCANSIIRSGIEQIFGIALAEIQLRKVPTPYGERQIRHKLPPTKMKVRHRTRSRELVRDEIDIKEQTEKREEWRDERKICGRCDRPLMAKMAKDQQPIEENGTAFVCKCGAKQLKDKDGVSKLMLGIGRDGKPAFREILIK